MALARRRVSTRMNVVPRAQSLGGGEDRATPKAPEARMAGSRSNRRTSPSRRAGKSPVCGTQLCAVGGRYADRTD